MVGCLLCSMARIYDLWDGSLDQLKVRGLDQDSYEAQEPQHHIDTSSYNVIQIKI